MKPITIISLWILLVLAFSSPNSQTVNATLDFDKISDISPLIYGYNQNHETPDSDKNLTARRLGGNRMSTFNWERNVENAGEGNKKNSAYIKTIVDVEWNDRYNPGEIYRKFHQDNLNAGIISIITVPLLGYVAADDAGTIPGTPYADPTRWKELAWSKNGNFLIVPDSTDDYVYIDESVNFLKQSFGSANSADGVKYISLGNEPALWENTHELVQGTDLNVSNYMAKVIAAAKAIKAVDPDIKLCAGEFAGINIYDLGSAPDWSSVSSGYNWFIDYFLDELRKASESEGYNLIDILALHHYPQHKVNTTGAFDKNGTIVRTSISTADYIRKTRMDFARSMWDTTYKEPSWLTDSKINGESHYIIGRLQKSIDTYFPGLKIMFGEFDYGYDADISHGIAMADLLGVFAENGVEIATRWDLESGNAGVYTSAAYKLFRNYDGADGSYGNLAVKTTFSNPEEASVWASMNNSKDSLHIILLNKNLTSSRDFAIEIHENGISNSMSEIFGFSRNNSNVSKITFDGTLTDDSLKITIPALSAYHVVIKRDGATALKSFYNGSKLTSITHKDNMLIIKIAEKQIKANVKIFSVSGKLLFENFISNNSTLKTSRFSKGTYLVQVEYDGNILKTRFVK